jgi:dihydroorotate dehydrogenase electron transfer subunit
MKYRVSATLQETVMLDEETFIHTYRAPEIARDAQPGQFLHVRVCGLTAPLLRRPISILWSDGEENVRILFKRIRSGTALLSEKRAGELVDLVGPLGHKFVYDEGHDAVMIAGGYGIAPLYFLARSNRGRQSRMTLIYGARTSDQVYLTGELRGIFDEVIYTTDDGSLGQKGRVTDVLTDMLQSRTGVAVYACGPTPMLAAVQKTVEAAPDRGIPCWVSMENQMGCGIGACLGCVIPTREGFKTTCKAGPVFNGYEVLFS